MTLLLMAAPIIALAGLMLWMQRVESRLGHQHRQGDSAGAAAGRRLLS